MTNSLDNMDIKLTACCWSTVSLGADAIETVQREAREAHPGAAIVVSCQRTEAYAAGPCQCSAPRRFEGAAAVRHLAEVAAGLHSVVLGEDQILGQVRTGMAAAPAAVRPSADIAVAAARALRRETRFNSHAGALLDRGLKCAGVTPAGTLLVLGTGQMARLIVRRAARFSFAGVVVAGRSRPDWLEASTAFVALGAAADLAGVQVVAGCLGSGAPEVRAGELPEAELLLDLGTPRNFGPGQRAPVLTLAALLADERSRPHAVRRRRELSERLAALVDEALGGLATDSQSPVGALRAELERIRRREVARMRRLHPELPEATLDTLTRGLVNQLFHTPTRRLQELGDTAFNQRVASLFTA